jgi:hypothetical protein
LKNHLAFYPPNTNRIGIFFQNFILTHPARHNSQGLKLPPECIKNHTKHGLERIKKQGYNEPKPLKDGKNGKRIHIHSSSLSGAFKMQNRQDE